MFGEIEVPENHFEIFNRLFLTLKNSKVHLLIRKLTNSSLNETTLEIWLMPIFFNKMEFLYTVTGTQNG